MKIVWGFIRGYVLGGRVKFGWWDVLLLRFLFDGVREVSVVNLVMSEVMGVFCQDVSALFLCINAWFLSLMTCSWGSTFRVW